MAASHTTSEVGMATALIALGFEKLMEILVRAEPILASVSYIVAIVAGLVTIYFKLKKKS